jgi:hypothetical protein
MKKTKTHLSQIQRIYDEAKAEIRQLESGGILDSPRLKDLYRQMEKAERILQQK